VIEQIPSYFDLNISFFILLVIGIIAGLFAYYQYRRTIPPVSKFLQITLGLIRGIAVACIILLIFAPEFTAIWQKTKTGKLLLAIDKSASMGIKESNGRRIDRALQIAGYITTETEKNAEILVYGFDVDTTHFQDLVMDTTRLGTNIDESLRSILNNEPDVSNIILISDGNFSVGDNPLYSDYLNNTNLYSVGIGDTLDISDIMITEVKSNKIVYQNQATQIQVFIMSRGIEKQRLNLSMKRGNRIMQVKEVEVSGDGKTVVSQFEVIPETVGLNQYDFNIESIPGEAISQNNRYTISMDVLKGKIKVGLLASKPDYETKFINKLLSNQEDIKFYQSVKIKSRNYYNTNPEKFIDSLDVIVLHNYPPPSNSDPHAKQIIDRLNTLKIPAFIILSESVGPNRIESVKRFFPLQSLRHSAKYIETQIKPSVVTDQLPLLRIFEDDETEDKFWAISPPIQYAYSNVTFSSKIRQLLQTQTSTDDKSGHPVLAAYEARGRKGILLLGSGFWRWDFLLSEDKIYQNSWQQMLKNLIRWLDTGAADKNVILSSRKKYYQVGDNILLTTQVYDGAFKYVNDGLIRTSVKGPSASFEIESSFVENGRYEGTFVPLEPGRYRIRSEAWRNNVKLGTDEFELVVTTVNREFLTTRQNHRFLKRLAEKTGGEYFDESNAADILNSLYLKPELKRETETFELWNRWPFLLVIIVLLSIEWFIRKKKDLA
jgi:hypothetical protein